MRKTTKKKIAPITVAVVVILYLGLPVAFILAAIGGWGPGDNAVVLFPVLCVLLMLGAGIGGILKALFQRLSEIDGGEEEEASQY